MESSLTEFQGNPLKFLQYHFMSVDTRNANYCNCNDYLPGKTSDIRFVTIFTEKLLSFICLTGLVFRFFFLFHVLILFSTIFELQRLIFLFLFSDNCWIRQRQKKLMKEKTTFTLCQVCCCLINN